jgi:histidyl-tRNA synthetase
MHHGQLTFPFKRYQIQPVWRADRPQRGRYREFYQCDADVVGSASLLNEVELTNIYVSAFEQLHIPVEIRINSRKILAALAEICGGSEKLVDITIAIDKLDKIGLSKVQEELAERGLSNTQIATITSYLQIDGDNATKLNAMEALLGNNTIGEQGLSEIKHVLSHQPSQQVVVDFTLARGLNYYTGIIFEIKAVGVQMGSIGGGGRYDDLTGLFGVPNLPGVGISFGIDRIYDVMEELNAFPATVVTGTKILFFNLGTAESNYAFKIMQQVRQAGIAAELYHEQSKLDKQFKYAEKKQIPFVAIIGSNEVQQQQIQLKNVVSGEQQCINADTLIAHLQASK